jgi:dTDP-glucose 4,6-dehydratase
MRLLVTGGAGFIGSTYVSRHLAENPSDEIVVLDKLTYAGRRENLAGPDEGRVTFVEGDIADREKVAEAIDGCDVVVNFAAESHVDRSIEDPGAFIQTDVFGTYVLLEAARDAGIRHLQISTDEVYGSIAEGSFTETSPIEPSSPYSASKAGGDLIVGAFQRTYGADALIVRASNNYGPRQHPEKLIPLMILNALHGDPLPIYGDGGNVRDWLHVEDHCAGLLLALGRGRPGEKYNIGGRNEHTNLEIVDLLCDALESLRPAASNPGLRGARSYRELKTFVPDRPGHDRRYAIDATKAERELGWAPRRGFAEGLRETAAWYLEHRDWCEEVQRGRYDRERLGLQS